MPTEQELLANKKLITVSNLTKYTTELKKYLNDNKQDKLISGTNIKRLRINNTDYDLLGKDALDISIPIARIIGDQIKLIPTYGNISPYNGQIGINGIAYNLATPSRMFLQCTIILNEDKSLSTNEYEKINEYFYKGIPEVYLGIYAENSYNKQYYYFMANIEKDGGITDYVFISFDGIYTFHADGSITPQYFNYKSN